ncbi:hypothetical protein M378DRAFT_164747 [Amanita muscaria Koide BX008]|uniref:Uncharacterized protein n=1 Tax=Amanita muscaria (strain Koide BX008) TaxID=946122 RepID=A0A0C2SJ35_AMAMK|nr:hypothetical protein M378DRAFT_164747 [Amanita muscaria Koide BX008]
MGYGNRMHPPHKPPKKRARSKTNRVALVSGFPASGSPPRSINKKTQRHRQRLVLDLRLGSTLEKGIKFCFAFYIEYRDFRRLKIPAALACIRLSELAFLVEIM